MRNCIIVFEMNRTYGRNEYCITIREDETLKTKFWTNNFIEIAIVVREWLEHGILPKFNVTQ